GGVFSARATGTAIAGGGGDAGGLGGVFRGPFGCLWIKTRSCSRVVGAKEPDWMATFSGAGKSAAWCAWPGRLSWNQGRSGQVCRAGESGDWRRGRRTEPGGGSSFGRFSSARRTGSLFRGSIGGLSSGKDKTKRLSGRVDSPPSGLLDRGGRYGDGVDCREPDGRLAGAERCGGTHSGNAWL